MCHILWTPTNIFQPDITYALQGENGRFAWSDGRPVIRTSWTQRYIHQPIESKIYFHLKDSWLLSQPDSFLQTLSTVSHTLQPDPNTTLGCTLGILSPYTGELDWVSVGCNSSIRIPLVACQSGSVSNQHKSLNLIYLSSLFQHLLTCGKSDSFSIRYNVTSCQLKHGNKEAVHAVLSPWIKQLCSTFSFLQSVTMYTCHTQFHLIQYKGENLQANALSQSNITFVGQDTFCPKYYISRGEFCYPGVIAYWNILGNYQTKRDADTDPYAGLHGNHSIFVRNNNLQKCAHFLFECQNGECIPMHHVLDGIANCPQEEDEKEQLVTDVRHLYCHNDNCVPWEHVCDNMMHCMTNDSIPLPAIFKCSDDSTIDSILVDDTVADCPQSSDEPIMSNLLASYTDITHNECSHGLIACFPGHNKCYAPYHTCKMAYTEHGHLRYCRNGAHLRSCEDFSCSGMYKCPMSHCIPYQIVCDNQADCPNGEDELNCHHTVICPGLLRCHNGGCVHPIHLCDGEMDCPEGDDELLCDLAPCPHYCSCLGVSMICLLHLNTTRILDISLYKHAIIKTEKAFPFLQNSTSLLKLDISGSFLPVTKYINLSEMKNLVYLDMSACNMLQLSSRIFDMLTNIKHLNLSSNGLTKIPKMAFKNNQLLENLDMSMQKLINLDWNLFSALDNLQYLNLSNNKLSFIDFDQVLKVPTNLIQIIIKGNAMADAKYTRALSTKSLNVHIVTDMIGICCVVNVTSCGIRNFIKDTNFCKSLTVIGSSETVVMVCLSLYIAFLNIISMTVRSLRKTHTPCHLYMEFSSLPKAIHLGMISVLHSWIPGLPGPYSFKHIWCIISGACQLYSILLTLSASVITTVEFHHGLFSIKRLQVKHVFVSFVFVNALITAGYTLYFTGLYDSDVPLPGPACSLLLWRSSKNTPDLLILLFFLCIISSPFGYVIYKSQQTYRMVLKSSQSLNLNMSVVTRRQRQVVLFLVVNLLKPMLDNVIYIAGIGYSVLSPEPISAQFILLLLIPTCFQAIVAPHIYLGRVIKTVFID